LVGLGACGTEGFELGLEPPGLDDVAPASPRASGRAHAHRLPVWAFTHAFEGAGWWILLDRAPDPRLGRGEPSLVSLDFTSVAQRQIDERHLSDDLLRWHGSLVQLLDHRGPRCTAVVERLALVSRWGPFFLEHREEGQTDAMIARELWASDDPALAARVTPVSGDCTGATWARAADAPAPELTPATRPSPALSRAALAATRQLPLYRRIDRRYRGEVPPHQQDAPWERHGFSRPAVTLLAGRGGQTPLVVFSAWTGSYCDEGFVGQLTAVWRLRGGADSRRLELVGAVDEGVTPVAAADLDGDGLPELFYEGGLLAVDGAGGARRDTFQAPSYRCPD
jgi:hypothetical protein